MSTGGEEYTPLTGPRVQGQHGGCVVAYPHHLGGGPSGVQDPVEEGVQFQGPELSDELRGNYSVEHISCVCVCVCVHVFA